MKTIKPGDIILWLADPRHWRVVEVRDKLILIEQAATDSREITFSERREVKAKECRLVGSQTEMEL